MGTFSPSLTRLIRRQHSVSSIAQLEDHGITRAQRRSLLSAGIIERIHRGVYIVATAERTLEARCAAACLANERLVISGTTAGRLHHLRQMAGDDIHAITNDRRHYEMDGVVIHRTNRLNSSDITVRKDGIRVLTPRRLAFDLADFLDDNPLESSLEQMLDRGLVTVPDLFASGRALRKPGRDGSVRFARVLAKRPGLAKPKNSDLEVKVLRALAARGVVLVPQLEVELPDGSKVHLDGGDRSRRFGVEVDHITWHGGRIASQYDKWRDRQMARLGWVVARVTDEDLRKQFTMTINDLVDIYVARSVAA